MDILNLEHLQADVVEWADSISPERKPKDAVVKMVSETSELLDAVLNGGRDDVEGELGDCLILLLDIADMYEIDILAAGRMKMEVNKHRDWKAVDGVIRRNKRNGHG